MIPDYQSLMLPVLKKASSGEIRISDVVGQLAIEHQLSVDEIADLLPSGKQTTFSNRVHWAKTYLKQAGLIETTKRGHFQITGRGQEILADPDTHVDNRLLRTFPEFVAFQSRGKARDAASELLPPEAKSTPEEILREAYERISESISNEVIDRLRSGSPAFFERAIVQLLLAMGYGGSSEDAGRAGL